MKAFQEVGALGDSNTLMAMMEVAKYALIVSG
jgi:hypothetical protein